MSSHALPHSFEEGESLVLRVDLPSLDEVELDVGPNEVRLKFAEQWHSFQLPFPVKSEAEAKFSKKRGQLTVTWALVRLASKHEEVEAPAEEPSEAAEVEAFGSIWNKNSWHWEEKNCMDLATSEVRKSLEEDPCWKHVPELSGHSIRFKEIVVKGDASFALRKKKRLLCYELSLSFKWEGRDDFGQPLGVKGSGQVEGITSEDEEPRVAIDVSVASGHEAAAAAEWMRSAGAGLLAGRLAAVELRQRMLRAEAKQQRPQEEIARRREEDLKTQAAATAAAKQHRISEEARQREVQLRAQMRPTAEAVSGSVWNVNAWHWEERPMTDWSITWITRELQSLAPRLLSGLVELDFREVQATGDASVSVRKGKPIMLYLLRIECRWEAAGAQGLGEAKGSLVVPEFSSEDGPKSSLIQVETSRDESRGRLQSAVRKEGVAAVRALLLRFEEALRNQLQRA